MYFTPVQFACAILWFSSDLQGDGDFPVGLDGLGFPQLRAVDELYHDFELTRRVVHFLGFECEVPLFVVWPENDYGFPRKTRDLLDILVIVDHSLPGARV